MKEIDIDKLKKVYQEFGEALGNEPFSVTAKENNIFYEENKLSEKEKLVFNYIKNHPGNNKESVVNGVKDYSRVTILKTIKRLVDYGLIFDKEDKNSSKRRHLFINTNNVFASLILKLDSFKEVYFSLISKTESVNYDLISKKPFHDQSKLIEALILPFKSMMLLMQYDLFGHIENAPNKDIAEKKVDTVYTTLQQIHLRLYKSKILKKFLRDSEEEILVHFFMNTSNGLSPENIIETIGIFRKLGISEKIENLIDCLWEISYSILPFVDLHYRKYDAKALKDWRKVMSEFDYSQNKNKPIHFPSSN